MVYFRRDFTPGGTYFFTLALRHRNSQLLINYIDLLGESFRRIKQNILLAQRL